MALTSVIGRIVEKVVSRQLTQFLQEKEIHLEENHGFTEGRGCSTAVLEVVQEMSEAIEDGEIPVLLGVDISMAFDCMDRQKLLRQLRIMSI